MEFTNSAIYTKMPTIKRPPGTSTNTSDKLAKRSARPCGAHKVCQQVQAMVTCATTRLGEALPLDKYFWPTEALKHLAELLSLAFSN